MTSTSAPSSSSSALHYLNLKIELLIPLGVCVLLYDLCRELEVMSVSMTGEDLCEYVLSGVCVWGGGLSTFFPANDTSTNGSTRFFLFSWPPKTSFKVWLMESSTEITITLQLLFSSMTTPPHTTWYSNKTFHNLVDIVYAMKISSHVNEGVNTVTWKPSQWFSTSNNKSCDVRMTLILWGMSSARNTLTLSVTHLRATPAGSSRLLSTSSLSLSCSFFSTWQTHVRAFTFILSSEEIKLQTNDMKRWTYRCFISRSQHKHADFKISLRSRARVIRITQKNPFLHDIMSWKNNIKPSVRSGPVRSGLIRSNSRWTLWTLPASS